MNDKDEKQALFWCNLLHPVIFGEIPRRQVNEYLRNLSKKEYQFPDGSRKRPSVSTLRRKLRKYQKNGFKSLKRKQRSDRGASRKFSPEIINKAVELKKEQPRRSDIVINKILYSLYRVTIPKTTLYRHLKRAGATKLKLGILKKKVRRRWTTEHTHDLWLGDFEYGPYVRAENSKAVPTYLSAFIDCASRYIVDGRYYLCQDIQTLTDCLLRAWSIHGKPSGIYIDNGKVYHSNALKAACYQLGINLMYRPVGDPAPGGLIEKFFQTAQSQFESEVRSRNILSVNELNQYFSAWLNECYHKTLNSETGQSPNQRYQDCLKVIRHVDISLVKEFFMQKQIRSVHNQFSDVRLDRRFYKVDPRLRGDKVIVRFDPYGDKNTVFIYSLEDVYLSKGTLYNRDAPRKDIEPAQGKSAQYDFLAQLKDEHNKELSRRAKGIDYSKLSEAKWPFNRFVENLSLLLGKTASPGDFTSGELETLKKAYDSLGAVNRKKLRDAVSKSSSKTLSSIISYLKETK